ncbi:MAG: ABC transporter ATP-binding protein [Planctomycetota bacterium]|jgi:ABC-2 type transport system ATP-binding protein
MIKVENLCKRFGTTRAVDQASFQVRRGEVVGFLGPNGAGKTTTMRLITGFLSPDSGTIEVGGIDVEVDPISVRSRIGYLPENAPLYHDLTALEYLRYMAAIRRIPRELRQARLERMVEACGLKEVLNREVGLLSKGYRQRVGLAQTMIHDPDILVLDEPTSGLDPNQIAEIREMIKEMGRKKTLIISTHILSEVQATCSRVLIINRGRIVADDQPESLARRIQGGTVYRLRVKGDREAMERALAKEEGIERFSLSGEEGEGEHLFRIHGKAGGPDLGEALFKLCVDQGIVLVEMGRETFSLEEIFSSLTREDVP